MSWNSNASLNATMLGREDRTADLCVIRIRPDAGVPNFIPGQFVRLGMPLAPGQDGVARRDAPATLVKRAYSVASSPHEREYYEFYVVKVAEGLLTPRIWDLAPGDRLYVDPSPVGEFTLEHVPPSQRLLMLATGTAIAPFISMLRTYAGQERWVSFVLVHGVRQMPNLGYDAELQALAASDPTLMYVPIISREPADSGWAGRRGRVQQILEPSTYKQLTGAVLTPETTHAFLCGNPEMVTSSRSLLEGQGFTLQTRRRPGNLHVERYW